MKKTFTNAIIGFLSQIIVIILGFVLPRIILVKYGSDTNGLVSTITQVFSYVALLEAGISQATCNALYNPIFKKDKDNVNVVLSASKKYFRRATLFYAITVIALSFLLPIILKTSVDYWTVFLIIFFEGFTSVISFYFLNVWICFLNSVGKNYIVNIFNTSGRVLAFCVKIVLALFGINFGIIQIAFFAVSLTKLLFFYLYMRNKFGWIKNVDSQGFKLEDRKYFLINEVASTVFTSTDMIVLSIFISASLSSVYSLYNMVFLALANLLNAIYSSVSFKLGLSYQKGFEEYDKVHDKMNILFMSGITTLMASAYVLIIPFIKIYTKDVTDIDYIYKWVPLLFCIVQLLSWSRYVPGNLTGLAGYAKKVSIVSIIEATLNVSLSILFVHFYGLYGVLIATTIAVPIKVVFCIYLSDIVIMKRSLFNTLKVLFTNYLLFGVVVLVNEFITLPISNYYQLIGFGVLIFVASIIMIFGTNIIFNLRLFVKKKEVA